MEKLLTHLLQHQDNRLRIFDMGRRVSKLPVDLFTRIEQQQIPYPSPFLHQAWIGLLLWNPKHKDQNLIWFLKLPLDEQGYLIQAARDDIVNRLLQNALDQGEAQEDALKDNPFAFTPDAEKMAVFHALAARTLAQPGSSYYANVRDYLHGRQPLDSWQTLGLQGLADYVMRLDEEGNEAQLARLLPSLPEAPLQTVARLLEHAQPGHQLLSALDARLSGLLNDPHTPPELIAALVRAISNAPSESEKQRLIGQVLHSTHAQEAEVIVAIATRCLSVLQVPALLQQFLEQLAQGKTGQAGFSRLLSDLMFMPAQRALILQAFRHPQRSPALTQAIGEMFGSAFSAECQTH